MEGDGGGWAVRGIEEGREEGGKMESQHTIPSERKAKSMEIPSNSHSLARVRKFQLSPPLQRDASLRCQSSPIHLKRILTAGPEQLQAPKKGSLRDSACARRRARVWTSLRPRRERRGGCAI